MIGYRFLTPAEIEMTEASAFYEAATAGLGSDFLDEIQRGHSRITSAPGVGPIDWSRIPTSAALPLPIHLIYSLEVDAILIIAVAHQRRRPGYWRDRK